MTKLIIKRSTSWTGLMRDAEILIDGKKFCKIGHGEVKEFEVKPGSYQFESKMDWCGSNRLLINIKEGETKEVHLSAFKFAEWVIPLFLFTTVLDIVVRYLLQYSLVDMVEIIPIFLKILSFIFFSYFLYFLTFGRNKFFQVEEKHSF